MGDRVLESQAVPLSMEDAQTDKHPLKNPHCGGIQQANLATALGMMLLPGSTLGRSGWHWKARPALAWVLSYMGLRTNSLSGCGFAEVTDAALDALSVIRKAHDRIEARP